jgi:hypothetical protein
LPTLRGVSELFPGNLPEMLLDWRESEQRWSRVSSAYSRRAFDRIRTVYLTRDLRIQGRRLVFWGAGRKTRQRARLLIESGFKPEVWIDVDAGKTGKVYHRGPISGYIINANPDLITGGK